MDIDKYVKADELRQAASGTKSHTDIPSSPPQPPEVPYSADPSDGAQAEPEGLTQNEPSRRFESADEMCRSYKNEVSTPRIAQNPADSVVSMT